MTTQTTVQVLLDNRIRLLSAVLAATDFPETSQQRKRYHAHAHARATRKYMLDNGYNSHPAVQDVQSLLAQNAPLEALYTLVLQFSWDGLEIAALPKWAPPDFNVHLKHFYETAQLAQFWQDAGKAWEGAQSQAERVFEKVHFKEFLEPFLGKVEEDMIFVPNICYPADDEIGLRVGNKLVSITPPPQAWGDSPPWPYDEDTMRTHSYRAALLQYARLLLVKYLRENAEAVKDATEKALPVNDAFKALYPAWEEQFVMLFITAAVAIYLEDYVHSAESRAYILMERKTRGMTILPGTISVLRRYLQEHGKKYQTLSDFLKVFPRQLRVAKKIVTL
ncbi:MAG: hypothetical protein ACPG7F_10330 [Aggregatilineales bacterium]